MKIDKDKLRSFGGLVFNGGISCVLAAATGGAAPAVTGAGAVLATVVGGITGSLAANHTAVLTNLTYDKLLERLSRDHPDDINHDLERLFRLSAVNALKFMKTLFLAEMEDDERVATLSKSERREFKKHMEGFFDENIKDLEQVTKDNKQALDKNLVKDPTDHLDNIVAQVFRMTSYSFDGDTEQQLRKFYADRLPYCFELAFKEALKADDKGYKAFQIWTLEELQQTNAQLLKGQEHIAELIKGLKAGKDVLSKDELDELLDKQAERIYELLSNDFIDIKSQLIGMSKLLEEQYELSIDTNIVANDTNIRVKGLEEIIENIQLERKYDHHLAQPLPPRPPVFLGRDEELLAIKMRLFENNHLLLLVNGDGGMGKTSLAAMYYHTYAEAYHHVAWVLKEQSIGEAMLKLADALKLSFDDNAPEELRVQTVFARMAELGKPCLLVIDNANEQDDLEEYYPALTRCSNFHILLTTRITEFEQAERYTVEGLPQVKALELFRKYYRRHKPEEDVLFTAIWEATGRNTLIIELVAKNLQVLNENEQVYSMEQLLDDLQRKGLLAIESGTVSTMYKGKGKFRKEKPEDIITAMYDLGKLDEEEVKLLSAFAVLPAENIGFSYLRNILEEASLPLLKPLYNKGWLTRTDIDDIAYYKVSPVIQEVTRKKNEQLLGTNKALVEKLVDLLEYQPGTGHFNNCSYKEATVYARYAEAVLDNDWKADYSIAILAERVGSYYNTTGNLAKALEYYKWEAQLFKELYESDPDNVDFKKGLAISYEKLGSTYSAMGTLAKALEYYKWEVQLFKELHDSNRDNVGFKHGLAISYEKLGDTYTAMGNLAKALEYYEQDLQLSKALHESYRDNVHFKHGLAVSYSKLGDTYGSMGNLAKALEYYEQRSALGKALYESYRDNVDFKYGLAISYERLGDTYSAMGNLVKALEYYEWEVQLFKELHDSYPDNVSFKHGLAISYERLGDTYSAMGNLAKALEYYEQRSALSKELHDGYRDNVSFKHGLAISYERLGDTYSAMGNLAKALEYYEQRSALGKALHDSYRDNVSFKHGLAISYSKLGSVYKESDIAKTKQYYEQAKELWQELSSSFPEYAEFTRNLKAIKNVLAVTIEQTVNINELDIVTAKSGIENIPIGTTGTVVFDYGNSNSYEVEFIVGDKSVVKTVLKTQIEKSNP